MSDKTWTLEVTFEAETAKQAQLIAGQMALLLGHGHLVSPANGPEFEVTEFRLMWRP